MRRSFRRSAWWLGLVSLAVVAALGMALSVGLSGSEETGSPAAAESPIGGMTSLTPLATRPPTSAVPLSPPPTTVTTTTREPVDRSTPPTPTAVDRPALTDALKNVFSDSWLSANLVSAEVWVVGEGRLFGFGSHLELLPASTEKILTAVGALEHLPQDHAFRTAVLHDPATGNLVLVAGGDPALTSDDLGRLAREVRAAGFTEVGDLVADVGRFSPDLWAPGWEDWHVPRYTGPLSTLIVDRNRHRTDDEFLADPDMENVKLFIDSLAAAGVVVSGEVRMEPAPPGAVQIVAHESPSVVELIGVMLRESNNEIAESLVREVGLLDSGDGSTLRGTLTTVGTIRGLGAEYLGTMSDGSGMSRTNATSATDLVTVLTMARDQDWFPQFLASLPVAGRSGTLANRLTGPATAGVVVAKTGTIIGGVALAGYAPLQDGSEAVFAIIINGEAAHAIVGYVDRFVITLTSVPNG